MLQASLASVTLAVARAMPMVRMTRRIGPFCRACRSPADPRRPTAASAGPKDRTIPPDASNTSVNNSESNQTAIGERVLKVHSCSQSAISTQRGLRSQYKALEMKRIVERRGQLPLGKRPSILRKTGNEGPRQGTDTETGWF
jgi:hypothetical protein